MSAKQLRPLPTWEKASPEEIDFTISRIKWEHASATYTESTLMILGHAVMEDWETPYMKALAQIACERGGTILEVGFGMGISAKFIQQHAVRLHVIIEANREVASKAVEFGNQAKQGVSVLHGFWEKACKLIPDGSIDGILFDTYPLSNRELYANHYRFFRPAFRMLRQGGILTYYSDEEANFSADHETRLRRAGFTTFSGAIVQVSPPPNCEYWQANTMFAPRVVK